MNQAATHLSQYLDRDTQTIEAYDAELWSAMSAETVRQEEHIELIASENYCSPSVLEAQGSVLTNKYAEGWSYYFAGGLVPDNKAGFTEDAITDGKFTLVLDDQGEGDVLAVDASGRLTSAKVQGGKVIALGGARAWNWLLLYPDGTIENYALNLTSFKTAIWRNTVGNENVAKNMLMIADCVLQ